MKRYLLVAICSFFGLTLSAAQIRWQGSGFSESVTLGTAYLIGVAKESASVSRVDLLTIKSSLSTTGIPTSYDAKYVTWGNLLQSESSGATDSDYSSKMTLDFNNDVNYSDVITNQSYILIDYFVVFIQGDKISVSETTQMFAWTTALDADTSTTNNGFGSIFTSDGVWYNATPVPEPTIWALLVLGVAGVALRRRAR